MTKIAIIVAAVALLAGCQKAAEVSSPAGLEFNVDRLFTHDGCTVYRFRDAGSSRYFTRCVGASSEVGWQEACGKGCSRMMNIPTAQGGREQ